MALVPLINCKTQRDREKKEGLWFLSLIVHYFISIQKLVTNLCNFSKANKIGETEVVIVRMSRNLLIPPSDSGPKSGG